MSETVMNETAGNGRAKNEDLTMYDRVEGIRNLNKVEGFDPRDCMRVLEGQDQVKKYYLDVAYRKLWFRLVNPEGRLEKKIIKLTEDTAVVEARIYLRHDALEGQYVANAFAKRDRNEGYGYLECAETAAAGRALSDAGFGTQFVDMECEADLHLADAPIGDFGTEGRSEWHGLEEGELFDETEALDGQYSIEDLLAMEAPDENSGSLGSIGTPKEPPLSGEAGAGTGTGIKGSTVASASEPVGAVRKDMPVEQIYSLLDRTKAAAVEVSAGFLKGKTLGQVAIEKPDCLKWYVESYGGPDNLLRAAARFLLDSALKQAG